MKNESPLRFFKITARPDAAKVVLLARGQAFHQALVTIIQNVIIGHTDHIETWRLPAFLPPARSRPRPATSRSAQRLPGRGWWRRGSQGTVALAGVRVEVGSPRPRPLGILE
jgi:hypothetical protein